MLSLNQMSDNLIILTETGELEGLEIEVLYLSLGKNIFIFQGFKGRTDD